MNIHISQLIHDSTYTLDTLHRKDRDIISGKCIILVELFLHRMKIQTIGELMASLEQITHMEDRL